MTLESVSKLYSNSLHTDYSHSWSDKYYSPTIDITHKYYSPWRSWQVLAFKIMVLVIKVYSTIAQGQGTVLHILQGGPHRRPSQKSSLGRSGNWFTMSTRQQRGRCCPWQMPQLTRSALWCLSGFLGQNGHGGHSVSLLMDFLLIP